MCRKFVLLVFVSVLLLSAVPEMGLVEGGVDVADSGESGQRVLSGLGQSGSVDWWPMFHHDLRHTGYSTSTAPNTNNMLWSYFTGLEGYVYSSPSVVNGKVYIGSNGFGEGKVYCFNATTGALIWNYTTADDVGSSPAVADGRVYIGSTGKKVYCLNATSGTLIWSYTMSSGTDSSAAVTSGRVYIASGDGKVYCLNAITGAFIWSYTTGDYVWRSPAVAYGKVYIGSSDRKVYCLNASSGAFVWSYTTGGVISSSAAVADHKVFIGSSDYKIYCLNATTGAFIWSFTTGGVVDSSPAVADGNVYVGSRDWNVYAFGPAFPVADADGPYSAYEGSPITFDASNSTDDGTIVLYEWDWNNNGTYDENTTSPFINHTWADDFAGTVGLRVTDNDGLIDTDTASVTVENVAPTVNAGPDQAVYVGQTVNFTGSFTDPGAYDTHTYFWDFGDGTNTTNTLTPTHIYPEAGVYTVTLNVTDDDGGSGIDTLNVTVSTVAVHDVAILNVTPSRTVVGQGYSMSINVTVENQGDCTESFNVTVFYDETAITLPNGKNHTTTTLTSGNSTTITFTWNTTGVAKGNYTISAYASPVLGETDTTDNTLADGMVTIAHPGDLNNDCVVDIADVVLVTAVYRSKCGEPKYRPNSDIIEDCVIDIADVVSVTAHYREEGC